MFKIETIINYLYQFDMQNFFSVDTELLGNIYLSIATIALHIAILFLPFTISRIISIIITNNFNSHTPDAFTSLPLHISAAPGAGSGSTPSSTGSGLGRAFIQAQVFVVLSCSYIKDAVELH